MPDVGPAHAGDINSLTFSHDGSVLVSGGDDGNVRIWNSATGHLIKDVPTGDQEIHAVCDVAYSPDGAILACAYFDGAVRLRDTTDWHELTISPLRHPDGVLDVSFAADGCRLATVGEDQHLRVWRLPIGTLEHDWPAKKEKRIVASFAHRGQLLASADMHPPAIHFWDPVIGQQTRYVPFGNRWIHAIDFCATTGGWRSLTRTARSDYSICCAANWVPRYSRMSTVCGLCDCHLRTTTCFSAATMAACGW